MSNSYSQQLRHASLPTDFRLQAQTCFGEAIRFSASACAQYAHDESRIGVMPPQAVLKARNKEDISALLALCHQYHVPVVARGAGSSIEGHILALQGGVALDLSDMNQILAIHAGDFCATVQPGVTRKQLNEALRDTGLFFPVDPGADASLGGMCATRASGTTTVRYGAMRENVLALEAVLADGRIMRCGCLARKASTGYDLSHLLIGSEGTLGVISEISVKLWPQPEALAVALASYADTKSAVETVANALACGLQLARIEFLDRQSVQAVNRHAGLGLPEQAMLIMELHGSPASLQEQVDTLRQLCAAQDCSHFEAGYDLAQRNRLWAARHQAYFSLLQMRPGARAITTDACVPLSQLAQIICQSEADCLAAGLPFAILGHVGDGNFHLLLLIDEANPHELALAESLNENIVQRALAAGGACSGEHGIGLHKIRFMQAQHGAVALDIMRSIKHSLDPHNIMNPGKMLPPA
ncbi:FAD-linked oxidase C-terminal domain-containing protein [Massilia sp. W12]|uniref:FAD-binding oxidoreductase n=1 Tax=Massilia sp. W12 TaxID=3126507 RepID=UPI0030D3330E